MNEDQQRLLPAPRGTAVEGMNFYVWDEDRRSALAWAIELGRAVSLRPGRLRPQVRQPRVCSWTRPASGSMPLPLLKIVRRSSRIPRRPPPTAATTASPPEAVREGLH